MTYLLDDFQSALERLNEAIEMEKTQIVRDSAIKRFELCFDLAWKTVKEYVKKEGVECHSPRECLKEAFQLKLIDNDERWMEMVLDRNISVHLYKKQSADEIYAKLPVYAEMLKGLLDKLQNK